MRGDEFELYHRTEIRGSFGFIQRSVFNAFGISNNGTENRCIIIIRFCSLIKCCCCCCRSLCSTLFSAFFLVALLRLSIVVLVKCNQARDHTIFLHKRQFIIANIGYCFSFKSFGSTVQRARAYCFRYISKRRANGCKKPYNNRHSPAPNSTIQTKAMHIEYRASLK